MKDQSRFCLIITLSFLLLYVLVARQARAQNGKACNFRAIEVQAFPLDDSERELQNRLSVETQDILRRINTGDIETILSDVEISDSDRDLLGRACTLHRRYKILIVPVLSNFPDVIYEVRGLHLSNIDMDRPQLALTFNREGQLLSVRILDEIVRLTEWEETRDELSDLPRGDEVLDLIKELETAYNIDALAVAQGANEMPGLSHLLRNAEINVSKLRSGRAERVTYNSSEAYIRNLVSLIRRVGSVPQITYELVNVYPHRDEFGNYSTSNYRVTLIQHWMFPPEGYIDTDYVSLDVELTNETFFRSRNAGRGSFSVTSLPSGIQISEIDNREIEDLNIKTPLTETINVPWQYHYLTFENVWYETEYRMISPEQVLSRSEISVEMVHRPGQIELTVLPDAENTILTIQNEEGGFDGRAFANGDVLQIPVSHLIGVPGPEESVESDERQVRIRLERESYNPVDTFLVLPGPEIFPVVINLEKRTGFLQVTSQPSASSVVIDDAIVGSTPYEASHEVTDEEDPLAVGVRNERCVPGDIATDCIAHIPSETRFVQVEADTRTSEHFELIPLFVRNLTEKAELSVRLERDNRVLTVDFGLTDTSGRNRKYIVDFESQDSTSWEVETDLKQDVVSCTSESACLGKSVRPGDHVFEWDMTDWLENAEDNSVPVLTVRRKGLCWPCVLIPAAAGVVSAYILPRTGSGGSTAILPPPRPDDGSNSQ